MRYKHIILICVLGLLLPLNLYAEGGATPTTSLTADKNMHLSGQNNTGQQANDSKSTTGKYVDRLFPTQDSPDKQKFGSIFGDPLMDAFKERFPDDNRTKGIDAAFESAKARFQALQAEGKAPTDEQYFQQALANTPDEQNYVIASIPYDYNNSHTLGEFKIWDRAGQLVDTHPFGQNDPNANGGTDKMFYMSVEKYPDPGWINWSPNRASIARGDNSVYDIHGGSGYSKGCFSTFHSWTRLSKELDYIINDTSSRGGTAGFYRAGYQYIRNS